MSDVCSLCWGERAGFPHDNCFAFVEQHRWEIGLTACVEKLRAVQAASPSGSASICGLHRFHPAAPAAAATCEPPSKRLRLDRKEKSATN